VIIDTNVSLSRWPFRRLPGDDPLALASKLRSHGVSEAWASSFDGILHKDLRAVNTRLVETCRSISQVKLRPFGVVNPLLPDWREDLRLCHEAYGMSGIRLFPAYHGYPLNGPDFDAILAVSARYGLIVQIAVRLEDPRVQHPRLRVGDVEVAPLLQRLEQHPQLIVVLLNAWQSIGGDTLRDLVATQQVYFDIATLEGMAGIQQCLMKVPADRILFGSHFPFFVLESSLLKLGESELSSQQLAGISHRNAIRCCQQAESRDEP
jgi:predicted TIM-barrel fold metal-dependent hydrolase